MKTKENRNFQALFKEERYLILKNYLYNYLLRKRAIEKCLNQEEPELILEIGSGISPLTPFFSRTVYCDLSFDAIRFLKRKQGKGYYVIADGIHLPFKSNIFSHAICSEVLEHIKNDLQAIKELARILKKYASCLVITVPHRMCYFSNDDHFVKHYRRYELAEIKKKLKLAGLKPIYLQKVLGPLEKITMSFVVYLFSIIQRHKPSKELFRNSGHNWFMKFFVLLFRCANLFYQGYIWLDAKLMPLSFSTVILIKSIISNKECKPHCRIKNIPKEV